MFRLESDRMAVSEGLSLSRQPLNKSQFIAVKLAMKQDITLIQGPPGAYFLIRTYLQLLFVCLIDCALVYCNFFSFHFQIIVTFVLTGAGKTVTGAHIAVQFLRQRGSSSRMGSDEKVRVLYCCPSNQTVDDITGT